MEVNPPDLFRFVEAQTGVYDTALCELRAGSKRSHWMWFIFPQVAGLGFSPIAQRFAIRTRGEATAYLAHPVLGPRLIECAEALLRVEDRTADRIMGYPDVLKLQSSMTLFAAVSSQGSVFEQVLDRYYGGERDPRTIDYLARDEPNAP